MLERGHALSGGSKVHLLMGFQLIHANGGLAPICQQQSSSIHHLRSPYVFFVHAGLTSFQHVTLQVPGGVLQKLAAIPGSEIECSKRCRKTGGLKHLRYVGNGNVSTNGSGSAAGLLNFCLEFPSQYVKLSLLHNRELVHTFDVTFMTPTKQLPYRTQDLS